MLVFAHRGASAYAPENSRAAFSKAIKMGAKAFEFDIQLTLDNQIVVFHDYVLERTSNGLGFLRDKTLDELKKLDIGFWYNPNFKGETISTLNEILELLPKDSFVNIELKRQTNDIRYFGEDLIKLIKPIKERVLISSFDWNLLEYLDKLEDGLNFGILIDKLYNEFEKDLKDLSFIPFSINPNYKLIDESFLETFKKYKIISYTVNDKMKAKELMDLGVYGIFSNFPDILK